MKLKTAAVLGTILTGAFIILIYVNSSSRNEVRARFDSPQRTNDILGKHHKDGDFDSTRTSRLRLKLEKYRRLEKINIDSVKDSKKSGYNTRLNRGEVNRKQGKDGPEIKKISTVEGIKNSLTAGGLKLVNTLNDIHNQVVSNIIGSKTHKTRNSTKLSNQTLGIIKSISDQSQNMRRYTLNRTRGQEIKNKINTITNTAPKNMEKLRVDIGPKKVENDEREINFIKIQRNNINTSDEELAHLVENAGQNVWNKANGPHPMVSDRLVGGGKLEVTVPVRVFTNRVVHVVDERFLSIGLDSNLIRNGWGGFNFGSMRLRTMAKALSPAYIRVMGTDGDRMVFNANCRRTRQPEEMTPSPSSSRRLFPTSRFYMYCRDWDRINRFAMNVGWRVLFGFNAQLRDGQDWDPMNADQLLNYTVTKSYAHNIDFELGNQPDAYPYVFSRNISAKQLANDYNVLRALLNSKKYRNDFKSSILGGPATGTISLQYMKRFLENVGSAANVITWHQYYGGINIRDEESAVDPDILDMYDVQSSSIMSTVRKTRGHEKTPVWLAETGSIVVPPGNNVYESFAMSFMLLDKLGMSAKNGIDVVVKQTFYGFWFALVDFNLNPTPGFWVAVLHKHLVGQQVLQVNVPKDYSKHVRVYAHCTNRKGSNYAKGAVTVFAMNLYEAQTEIKLDADQQEIHQYLLTPYTNFFGIASKYVALNGRLLNIKNDRMLPKLRGKVLPPGAPLMMPPRSIAFYVLPAAKAPSCMTQ